MCVKWWSKKVQFVNWNWYLSSSSTSYLIYLLQELMVPMNDIDIYDGESIDGSLEAKSKNNWVQIFDMIDLTFNNLQQQNKELKRTVNELSSKVNKVSI